MIMLGFSGTLVLLISLGNARALMLSIRRLMIILQRGRFGHVLDASPQRQASWSARATIGSNLSDSNPQSCIDGCQTHQPARQHDDLTQRIQGAALHGQGEQPEPEGQLQ
jgi:hypothetical protein